MPDLNFAKDLNFGKLEMPDLNMFQLKKQKEEEKTEVHEV